MFKGLYNYFYFSGYSFIGFIVGTGWLFFLPDSIYIVIGGYIFAGYFQCTYLHREFMLKTNWYKANYKEMPEEMLKHYKTKIYKFYGTTLTLFFGLIFSFIFSNL